MIVRMVRNSQKVGRHGLRILGDRRRINVLLSRARHKLVLVTSMGFLRNAVSWHAADGNGDLDFLVTLLRRIDLMVKPERPNTLPSASIVFCDERGQPIS